MILIYTKTISSRLTYTLNVLFKYVMGVDYKLTTSLENFIVFDGPKLNYSEEKLEGSIKITPSRLLFEKEIKEQNIEVDFIKEIPYFFKTNEHEYDVLAASFWMLTRYEEYLPYKADSHERFPAEESLAFKNGFLKKPVVNIWVDLLQKRIQEQYPKYKLSTKKTSYLNTLDIDIAYVSRGKNWVSFLGGLIVDILKNKKDEVQMRLDFFKTRKDTYDTYDFIEVCAKEVKTQFFFLLGDKSKYDLNIRHSKKCLKKLIKRLSKNYPIGIHPSYQSNEQDERISKEIKRLRKITNLEITTSRQHFLKLEFPKTYENLIRNKIKVDYSLGFASQVGFRAGICNAYPFYNLEVEKERPLWLVPFQVMDGTLKSYLKLTPEEGIEEIKKLINEVEKVNGLFVPLWHNSSLSEKLGWQGWRVVYKEMLTLMK